MARRSCLAIVLAAGEGTRMPARLNRRRCTSSADARSLAHASARIKAGGSDIAVVVGPEHVAIDAAARALAPKAKIFVQKERRGTGHMRGAGGAQRPSRAPTTHCDVRRHAASTAGNAERIGAAGAMRGAAVVAGFRPASPVGYGRLG